MSKKIFFKKNFQTNILHILDCLRKDFEETLIENNLNCTYPWIESMRGSLNYIEEEKPTCTAFDNYQLAQDISRNYATAASAFSHQKCLGTLQIKSRSLSYIQDITRIALSTQFSLIFHSAPCRSAKYSAGFTAYDSISTFSLDDLRGIEDVEINRNGTANSTDPMNDDHNGKQDEFRLINLFYSTTDEIISTTELKCDFNTFVSNVGGSLGLFVEFSVLGGFYIIYDLISSRMEKIKK